MRNELLVDVCSIGRPGGVRRLYKLTNGHQLAFVNDRSGYIDGPHKWMMTTFTADGEIANDGHQEFFMSDKEADDFITNAENGGPTD